MQYDKEFKLQALQLSDEIGVKSASEQLGINYYTLAGWRKIRKGKGTSAFVGSGHSAQPVSDKDQRIRELEKEHSARPNAPMRSSRRLSVFSRQAERNKSSHTVLLYRRIQIQMADPYFMRCP